MNKIIALDYIQQVLQIIDINKIAIILVIRFCQPFILHLQRHKTTYQGEDDIR